MYELNAIQWAAAAGAAAMIGISKTGVAGTGILAVLLMAWVLPARASTGLVLPLLVCADIFAVTYYRRKARWEHIRRLLPWALAGIGAGYFLMGRITDSQLQPVIGAIVLGLLAVNRFRNTGPREAAAPQGAWFPAAIGLMAGLTTMLSNAAGPIMIFYFLSVKLSRFEFIGTAAWYFFILNLIKLPLSADLGLINSESLRINLSLVPAVAFGALSGIVILRKIPGRAFNRAVELLAFLAALRLLLGSTGP